MRRKIAINTDYAKNTGSPEPYLKRISEAGFTHIMWCHHWNDDFLYSDSEINQISKLLKKYRLQVLHVHASCGKEKNWISQMEHERQAGVELVKNRIYMSSRFSCNVIVMHLGYEHEPRDTAAKKLYWKTLHKTFDDLEPFAKKHKVRIALENPSHSRVNGTEIKRLLSEYKSNFLGFCYDTGHGNFGDGLELLGSLINRLIAIHLNDNNGHQEQHNHLFSKTVDWKNVAKLIAESVYTECMCLELKTYDLGVREETQFLRKAYKLGLKFSKMVDNKR